MFEVPLLRTKSIPYTRVNHNKYMVTDNAAYIGKYMCATVTVSDCYTRPLLRYI